ncbi:MAG: HEPN domain-containing protein [Candidatus Electrothrix sp. Rat3]|nr:HEPN domain-containing protein [Candidatus Electrothrix rattekaaiensis]
MNKEELIKYWIAEAEESLSVAGHLFEKKDYSYSLFFGHLAVEKILKAVYVEKKDENVPRSHNLPRIAKAATLTVPEDKLADLIRITAFNIEARYPDYKRNFRKKCTPGFTKQELEKIREVFTWLKSTMQF